MEAVEGRGAQGADLGRLYMVDVSGKRPLKRTVVAEGEVRLRPETVRAIVEGRVPKGDVATAAKAAAVLAAKSTHLTIPLAHPIPVHHVDVKITPLDDRVKVRVSVTSVAPTGPELEALNAVMASLLTIWDMVKQLEKDERGLYPDSVITGIRVVEKRKEEPEW